MTIFKANVGSTTGPLQQGPRADLDNSLRNGTVTQPFTGALFTTNRRLGIHGDHTLDAPTSHAYQQRAQRVESGEITNSTAFAESALQWAKKGEPTGVLMNTAGFLLAGGYEASKRKIGK
ncbi:hypothetical protein ACFJGW_18070 [Burkholderiaceae bacterium UC74_6]